MLLYVHRGIRTIRDGETRTATSTFTQPLSFDEAVPVLQFVYLAFTRMPGKSYSSGLRSLLLCLCDVLRVLIKSLVC